jgi:nucleoside phosphorylase
MVQAHGVDMTAENPKTGDKASVRRVTPSVALEPALANVLVITNLPIEYEAAYVLFAHASTARSKVAIRGFELDVYRIPTRTNGYHDVLLGLLPSIANSSAASNVGLISGALGQLQTIMSIGIAGAVPNPGNPETHVRLGDLVVTGAGGTVQFDFRKLQVDSCAQAVSTPRHPPRPPSPYFLSAALRFQSEVMREPTEWHHALDETVQLLGPRFRRPALTDDVLYIDGSPAEHPQDPLRTPGRPQIFIGTIGSSNTLLKDPKTRDELGKQHGIRAIEMEAAGVADVAWQKQVGFYSIRGTVDYCDINKGDVWHSYAAAIAAMLTCRLIANVPSSRSADVTLSEASLYVSLGKILAQPGESHVDSVRLSRDDFETGRIVAHPLHDEALSKLRESHVLSLVGPMGSGKSVLARAVAISLEKSGAQCVFLPPDHVTDALLPHLLTELSRLPAGCTLVLEDIHRDPTKYNILFEAARAKGLDVILTSRPSFYSEVHRHAPLSVTGFLDERNSSRVTLIADDVAAQIVNNWFALHNAGDHNAAPSAYLNAARHNLWALTFLLRHSAPGATLKLDTAYGSIIDVIEDSLPTETSRMAYVAICLAYQFEIPLPASLLGLLADATSADLVSLHKSGLTAYSGVTRSFSIPHAGQAQLSLDAFEAHRHRILHRFGTSPERRAAAVLCKYLQIQPAELALVMRHVRNEPRYVEALSQEEQFCRLADDLFLDTSASTWDLAHFLSDYTRVTNDATRARAVGSVDVSAAVRRLDRESDLNALAAFLDAFPWSVSQLAVPLVEEVNAEMAAISRHATGSERDDQVGFCRWMVASSEEVPGKTDVRDVYARYDHGKMIPLERFSEDRIGFCSKSSATGKVIMCGKSLVSRPHTKSIEIIRALDSSKLAAKLDSTTSAYTVAHVIDLLHWIDATVAREVVCQMDVGHLKSVTADPGDAISRLLRTRLSKILPDWGFQ